MRRPGHRGCFRFRKLFTFPLFPLRVRRILGNQPASGCLVGSFNSFGFTQVLDRSPAFSVQIRVFCCGDVYALLFRCKQLVAEDDQLIGIIHKGQRGSSCFLHRGDFSIPIPIASLKGIGLFEVCQKPRKYIFISFQDRTVGAQDKPLMFVFDYS